MPLDIKVRYRLFWLILGCLSPKALSSGGPKCDKTPLGQEAPKTPGEHGFYVTVAGSPRLYRPGQVYTVSLAGMRMDEGDIEPKKVKFIDFMIVAESNLPSTEVSGLGTFQIMPGDAMSKFSHKCSHAVMATSALSKEEVHFLWTAPEQGSGCINLKAMVVERNDFWFMDDGALTYTICEDDSPMAAPPLVEPCKACDEAKYEVIFEGLWSRHTHPKDFPVNEWQTQFSHLIGASHSIDYDLWKYGELASPALTMLAETGQTKKLEIDMKRFSKNIRSVIKARGLQQRSNVVGRTFAVFRMDATKHLLSLVSKIIPSPDWIVGVSMENLCLSNGSWVDSRVLDLYPWDAGTSSGLTYQEKGEETMPRQSIHRITSCTPNDERSPFFDSTCAPVKPVARLHILKQREYKKDCANGDPLPLNPAWSSPNAPSINGDNVYSGTGIGPGLDSVDETKYSYGDYDDTSQTYRDEGNSYGSTYGGYGSMSNPCSVTGWSSWTPCSQSCDTGSQSRTRKFHNPVGSQIASCKTTTFEKQPCPNLPKCETKSYAGSFDPFFSQDELSEQFSSTWNTKGLVSKSLTKEKEPANSNSYLYSGGYSQPQVGNPSSYDPSIEQQPIDMYSDPYNKYSGYAKQKGYPPKHNHPSSSRYNPYKEMGYYGYTYGGPPTGRFNQPSFLEPEDIEQSDASPTCDVTEWGDWSHCSTNCGTGTRTRTRHYTDIESTLCSKELFEDTSCEESSGCSQDIIQETQTFVTTRRPHSPRRKTPIRNQLPTARKQISRNKQRKQFKNGDPQCEVAEWTDWSPCSVSCDHGYKIRTRIYLMPFVPNRVCDNIRLTERMDCRLQTCYGSSDYYENDSPPMVENEYSTTDDDGPITIQIVEKPNHPYCNEDFATGSDNCFGKFEQWYYDAAEGKCSTFMYTGCGGNKNNFNTETECLDACHPNGPEKRFNSLKSLSLVREDYLAEQERPVDCQISEWSEWSPCSASCGRGWMTQERSVLAEPKNGGKSCPKKLSKKKKCKMIPCAANPSSWYQSNWRMLQGKTGQQGSNNE